MTTEQDMDTGEVRLRYFIDLDWYQQQERSFATLASSRLCPTSRKKEKTKSEAALLRTIRQCCSKRDGFITPNMPLLEMIFRLLLANGNQPLELGQMQEQLQKWLGDSSNARDLSVPKLKRILSNDQYYGLRPAPLTEEEKKAQ
jgi:hypothetical protein